MKKQSRLLILKHAVVTLLILVGSISYAQLETGVATTGVNFRSGPSTKYRVITGVGRGEYFEIIKQVGSWTQVRLENGKKGYIYSKYVGRGKLQVPETEGGYCEHCDTNGKTDRLPVAQAEEIHSIVNPAGAGGQCLIRKLYDGANKVVKKYYGTKKKDFRGKCALAVRQSLNAAGIWKGGGIGHARSMVPGLQAMGFKNIKTKGMTPESAPAGTILVYGRALKGAKGCRGLGTTYGHVEIKKSNSSYIYDGFAKVSIQKIFKPACRPLIGVMQMGNSCPTCKADVKRACGV